MELFIQIKINFSLIAITIILGCEFNSPNILWLVAEDLSPFYLNAYGDCTPNFVWRAQNFSVSGVCSANSQLVCIQIHLVHADSAAEPEAGIIDYQAVPPDEVKMVSEIMRENGYYTTNNAKEDYQFFKSELAWDESSIFAHWRNRPDVNIPFFSIFNFGVCHESGMWNTKANFFDTGDEFPLAEIKKWWVKYNGRNQKILVPEDLDVQVPPYLPQNKIGKNAMKRMYTNIIRMDKGVGRILNQLEEGWSFRENYYSMVF